MTTILARIVRALVILFVLHATVALLYPPARLATLWAVGRSDCELRETQKAFDYSKAFTDHAALVEKSTKIQTDGEYQLWKTPLGNFWIRRGLEKLNRFVVSEQLTDVYGTPETFGVKPGDIVVDCGADYGMFTRRALQHGAAKVFAVEIADYKKVCLRRTFEREIAEGRVVVSNKGVWDKDDTLKLHGDSVVIDRPGEALSVAVAPLDDLLAENGFNRVDFLKFDIEGAEPQAIRGAQKLLRQFRPRIVIATENFANEKAQLGNLLNEIVPGYTARSVSCGLNDDFLSVASLTTVYYPPAR